MVTAFALIFGVVIGTIVGAALGWIARGDRDIKPANAQLPPATCRQIRRNQRAMRADVRSALTRRAYS